MKRSVVLLVCLLGLGGLLAAQQGSASKYTSVAPGPAQLRAMRLSLEFVGDWIEQNDLKSAADTCEELLLLAQLARLLEGPDAWREQLSRLEELTRRIQKAARSQSRDECRQLVGQTETCLKEMGETARAMAPGASKSYRATGAMKTWMGLLDSAYCEARAARSVEDMELLTLALAEQANALAYLRSDGHWRATSQQLRDVALEAGRQARSRGLEAGKAHLKQAYGRCEACHQGFRR